MDVHVTANVHWRTVNTNAFASMAGPDTIVPFNWKWIVTITLTTITVSVFISLYNTIHVLGLAQWGSLSVLSIHTVCCSYTNWTRTGPDLRFISARVCMWRGTMAMAKGAVDEGDSEHANAFLYVAKGLFIGVLESRCIEPIWYRHSRYRAYTGQRQ